MSGIHSHWKQIPESEIGDFSHVDHQNYIRWMREMTQAHFATIGFDRNYFVERGECFVVRRHSVEHLAPCFLDDQLLLVTWISELGNKAAKRQHRIFKFDESGNQVPVVRAQNLSIFVDTRVSPVSIPAEIGDVLTVLSEREVNEHILSLSASLKMS